MPSFTRRSVAGWLLLALLASASGFAAFAADSSVSGDRTPMGWLIKPAGTQMDVLRFPLGLTATPDGSQVIVSSNGGGVQGLTTIDTATLAAVPTPQANLFMGVAVAPSGEVFASGGNADRVFRFRTAGPATVSEDATEQAVFPLHAERDAQMGADSILPVGDGIRVSGYPGNVALGGNLLYIAGTLSEASGSGHDACPSGQAACGRVTILDTASGTVLGRAPAGLDVYGVAVDPVRKRVYASNWADEAGRGGATGGTVSVIDATNPAAAHEIAYAGVGHHPSSVQLSADRTRLFVANTNDDSISVLDVSGDQPRLVHKVSVKPLADVPVGAHPDAFALSPDGNLLFVALAGLNAVEVLDGHTGMRPAGQPRYIPTGYYPSALTVTGTAKAYKLWVANAKGRGPGQGPNGSVFSNGINTDGSVNVVDLPASPAQENAWTRAVYDNDQISEVTVDPCAPHAGVKVSEVLCPPHNGASPIKHVLYIVTENKTFDQYFGDLDPTKYDAAAYWTLYGRGVTTNHHAMADRWSLSDRFFSDAEVSVTGHSWTSGAIATDHNEKIWPTDYEDGVRGNHGGGDPHRPGPGQQLGNKADDELQDPEGGYIFEAFKRAGAVTPDQAGPSKLSMAIYGERTARESGNMDAYKAPGWKDGDIAYFDTCRATQFITGHAAGDPNSGGDVGPSVPELGAPTLADCENRSLPGQFNLQHWEDVYKATGKDVMPNFIYMSLPVNHTLAANLGSPTPASMVADNDYAIGLITQALSKSPFWGSTVIMQTEDDTQAAGDHVSALRDYLQVSGPLAKPGPNHQWGSMPSLLRTIETIFKVKPIALNDRLALPQHEAFLPKVPAKLDLTPYTAQKPPVPFALNGPGTPGQAASMAMDWSTYDRIDEATVNAILYAIGKGWPLDLPAYAQH
ncbi:MAG: bifunctional YncE family protein/alkaline phosphatase family protein [Actinobacteria bacterium]|nr:bifunctional YncE family protein/alkaline phosphatase family protein [Actinomycetota bacterium]